MSFSISIIGLGLMGGSLAYALKGFKACIITGFDKNEDTLLKALNSGAIDKAAKSVAGAVKEADLSIFCTYPSSIIKDIQDNVKHFKKGSVVTEICGVKAEVAPSIPPELDYVGLHPMAGKEVDGFENADATIFKGAGFIIIPREGCGENAITLLTELSRYTGAGHVCINTPEQHDRIIAYTSDLMHIAASALCHSYPEDMTMVHTAGAFRDCTRVANLNAASWTELLLMNRHSITPFLDDMIHSLSDFSAALKHEDDTYIKEFLQTSCDNKKEMIKRGTPI